MNESMNTYERLIVKLDEFIRRFYVKRLLRGAIYTGGIFAGGMAGGCVVRKFFLISPRPFVPHCSSLFLAWACSCWFGSLCCRPRIIFGLVKLFRMNRLHKSSAPILTKCRIGCSTSFSLNSKLCMRLMLICWKQASTRK